MPRPFACPARARPAVYVPLAVRFARPVGPRLASVARFSVPPSINRGLARGYATEKEAGGGGPGGTPGGGAGGEPGGDGAGAPGAEGAAGSGGIDEEPRATQTTRGLEEDADEAADRELENETGFDPDPLYAFVAPPVLTLFTAMRRATRSRPWRRTIFFTLTLRPTTTFPARIQVRPRLAKPTHRLQASTANRSFSQTRRAP